MEASRPHALLAYHMDGKLLHKKAGFLMRPDSRRTSASFSTFQASHGPSGRRTSPSTSRPPSARTKRTTKNKAPDFRILAGATEFGAAWKKTSREGRDYLSVKLDDPSFPAPIYASLVEAEDGSGHNLIWSRRNGD